MNTQTVLAIIAAIIGTTAFYPYIRDIFTGRTRPHIYTWIIWALTQGTASVALLYGGGGIAGLNIILSTVLEVVVVIFAFRWGTKNITRSDTIVLVLALLAIIVWWQLHNPYLAVAMVSGIDAFGYIPTIRKSYQEPWSETTWAWASWAVSDIIAICALSNLNFLTVTYLATITVANLIIFSTCYFRRRSVPKPV